MSQRAVSDKPKGLSTGAKVGIGVAIAIVAIVVIVVIVWLVTRPTTDSSGNGGNGGDNGGSNGGNGGGNGGNTGCTTSADCSGTPATPVCRTSDGVCVACMLDGDCETDETCLSNTCVCPTPIAPADVIAVYTAEGQIDGTYTEVAGNTYAVEISTSVMPEMGVIATGVASGGIFSISFTPSAALTLYVRLRATNSCGQAGPWSDNTMASELCKNPSIDFDSASATGTNGSTSISIVLNDAPPGARLYEASIRDSPNGGGNIVGISNTQFTATGVNINLNVPVGIGNGTFFFWARDITFGCLESDYADVQFTNTVV